MDIHDDAEVVLDGEVSVEILGEIGRVDARQPGSHSACPGGSMMLI
jgi:hypothetical protein